MIRKILTTFFAASLVGVGLIVMSSPAEALSKEEIQRKCEESIKEEFGEAKAKFDKFRRNGNKEMAFGELEMKDGTTRPIRCRVRRGTRVDVRFPSGSEGGGNEAWTADRPENAGFIKPKEAEKPEGETEEAADDSATAKAEPTGPVRRRVGGDDANAPAEDKNESQSGDEAAQSDPDQGADDAEGNTDADEAASNEKPEEEERTGPVFRKVPTK